MTALKTSLLFTGLLTFSGLSFAQNESPTPETTASPTEEVTQVQPTPPVPMAAAEAETSQPVAPANNAAVDEKLQALQTQIEELQKQVRENKKQETNPVPSVAAPTTSAAPAAKKKENDPEVSLNNDAELLRPRENVMTWGYDFYNTKTTEKTGGTSTSDTVDSSRLNIGFAKNLEIFEVGFKLTSSRVKDDDFEGTQTGVWVTGDFNFVPNKPGNDVIPYLTAMLGAIGYTSESLSGKTELAGSAGAFGVGLKWFPFSEIFALDMSIRGESGTMETDEAPKIEIEARQTVFNIGWRIYF
ncbi:hypothetical protein QJS83_11515 [Bdellovibrio sp. 22V]|uniref:type IV pilus assembly protein FimV n=1 Tax=Bdellovibrio TaxID=958 RepID=UPI002543C23D|nr:hypothetical protein [Bdellovibrio sp. 22V]WII71089.1 hypothetical protein QJS83_11515 [Bdellovibrio sp. 22V]